MDLRTAIKSDWQIWDGLEAVTLTVRKNSGDIDYVLASAKRRVMTNRELAASAGRYTGSDLVWLIPAELLAAGVRIKPADTITESPVKKQTWTVLEASEQTLQTIWKLMCRDMVIAYDLRDLLTLEIPVVGQEDSAARANEWEAAYSDIACRMQPLNTEVFEERGKRTTQTRFDCFISQQVNPWNEDGDWGRVLLSDSGKVYTITGYRQPDRIDQLPVLECVLQSG